MHDKGSWALYNNVITLSMHACKYIYIPKCMIFSLLRFNMTDTNVMYAADGILLNYNCINHVYASSTAL